MKRNYQILKTGTLFIAVIAQSACMKPGIKTVVAEPSGVSSVSQISSPSGDALPTPTFSSTPISMSLSVVSVIVGGNITLTISGGLPPYSLSDNGAGGIFSGMSYSAPNVAGTVTLQASDSLNNSISYQLDVRSAGSYTQNRIQNSFNLIVDDTVSFSYHYAGSGSPSFTFFGMGPNTSDATSVAQNLPDLCFGTTNFNFAPCTSTNSLTNYSPGDNVPLSYRGSIALHGRSGGGNFDYCISPDDPTKAYLHATHGNAAFHQMRFDAVGLRMYGGAATYSAFMRTDSRSGPGNTTVSYDGAYSAQPNCADFDSSTFIQVSN